MLKTDKFLQFINQLALLIELCLLLFDSVVEHDGQAFILYSFDRTLRVVSSQQRLDCGNLLGDQAEIAHSILFPGKSDRAQTLDEFEAD